MAETLTTANAAADRALAEERAALDGILGDFEIEQRRVLLMAVDKAIDKAIKKQGEMLESVKTRVANRQCQAITHVRDALAREQPTMIDLVIAQTLDAAPTTSGLLRWIHHPQKQQHARECVERLRNHLETRQGNLFRSDFEALLVVYMEYLNIPMARGSRLSNRIEDFKDALHRQAALTDDLANLAFRVNWACYGVRTIGNARSHDATPLSDAERLELCGCFSALGAAMPTLAQNFEVVQPEPVSRGVVDERDALAVASNTNGGSMDLSAQLWQLAGAGSSGNAALLLQQFLAAAGLNNGNGGGGGASTSSGTSHAPPPPPLLTGYPSVSPTRKLSAPPGLVTVNSTSGQVTAPTPPSPPPPPPRPNTGTISPPPPLPPAGVVPTQAALAAVSNYKFYHERPNELPKESDRTRMAMFARMINHMNLVPKARLCPFPNGHDPQCPHAHSYLEVMSYNPLFKRLVCRQPSHYWASQVAEDESCVCLHVDTGLKWDWLDEARDKRMYCVRGNKCTNHKCFKSHSFKELCWYNPSYKIKKCALRAHDSIVRARGTIAPPLDCNYYHIEVGPNADMRQLMVEDDHVGQSEKLLFAERTHKPLADALEALRYARANNL